MWLSLVEHLVRDEGVAGSNPATPTNFPATPTGHAARYAGRNPRSAVANSLQLTRRFIYGRCKTRVPVPVIEQLVLDGVRAHLRAVERPIPAGDRHLIEHHVDRVIVRPQAVEVRLTSSGSIEPVESSGEESVPGGPVATALTLP